MKLHRQARAVYKTQYHIIWVTRYQRKIHVRGIAEYFKQGIRDVRGFHPDWMIEEVGVDEDHVQLRMVIPPKYAASKVTETLKSVTSKRLKMKFPHFLSKVYYDDGGISARRFFVSTVRVNEATIRRYVRYQGKQDAGQAKLELLGYPACKRRVLHARVFDLPLRAFPNYTARYLYLLASVLTDKSSISCGLKSSEAVSVFNDDLPSQQLHDQRPSITDLQRAYDS